MATTVIGTNLNSFTEYPNTFRRQGAFPLEQFEIFTSLDAAKQYAKEGLQAYNGQRIVVIDLTTNEATVYYISSEQDLVEVASRTQVQGEEARALEVEALLESRINGMGERLDKNEKAILVLQACAQWHDYI